jgi:hypothetical protein
VQGLFWVFGPEGFFGRVLDGMLYGCTLAGPTVTWTIKWPLSPRFFMITEPKNVEYILKTRFGAWPLRRARSLGRGTCRLDASS